MSIEDCVSEWVCMRDVYLYTNRVIYAILKCVNVIHTYTYQLMV